MTWLNSDILEVGKWVLTTFGAIWTYRVFRISQKQKSFELAMQLDKILCDPIVMVSRKRVACKFLRGEIERPLFDPDVSVAMDALEVVGLAVRQGKVELDDAYNFFFDLIVLYERIFSGKRPSEVPEQAELDNDVWSGFFYLADSLRHSRKYSSLWNRYTDENLERAREIAKTESGVNPASAHSANAA